MPLLRITGSLDERRRGPIMHGTIGSINGCGRRLHDRPGEKRPVLRVIAAIGFFLLIFGSASIGMGAAIALSGTSFGTSGRTWNAAEAAVHNNDLKCPVAKRQCARSRF